MSRWKEHLRRRFFALPKRLWAMCAVTAALCLSLWAIYLCTDIVTVTNSQGERVVTLCGTPDKFFIAKAAGFSAYKHDELTLTETENGLALHIEHTFPVAVTADGKTTTAALPECTVAEALGAFGIALGTDDYTEPAMDAVVTRASNTIKVHRVTYKDYSVDKEIPYETQEHLTSLLYRKPDKVLKIQDGVNGHYQADLRDKIVDGQVVETIALREIVNIAPIPEIIKKYGAGAPVSDLEAPEGVTIENGVPSTYSEVYTMRATGYSSKKGKGASGLGLYYGTFAVDPKIIPFGTKVYIASEDGQFVYGWAIATDTGGFIHKNNMQVDLFYESFIESYLNAVQTVKVYVIE